MTSKTRILLVLLILAALPARGETRAGVAAEVEKFALEYLPWEPETRVAVQSHPSDDIRGFHAFQVERTGKYEKLNSKTIMAVSADEKWIFTGSVVKNGQSQANTAPIQTDRDVSGIADYFSGLFHARARAALEPARDRAGLKGVRVEIETGFFSQPLHYFIEPDGSAFFMGQLWKLGENVASQRRALMDLSHSPSRGVEAPKFTVVEYADMECPFCKKRGQQMDKLEEAYGKKLQIRRYYKYYPLWVAHVWSTKAASAAVCLSHLSPDLVFRFKQLCYDNQEGLDLSKIDQLAFDFVDSIGAPRKEFLACYLQESSLAEIRRDMEEGGLLGVNSTPTYYINGVEVYWLPDEVMEEYLKSLLSGGKRK